MPIARTAALLVLVLLVTPLGARAQAFGRSGVGGGSTSGFGAATSSRGVGAVGAGAGTSPGRGSAFGGSLGSRASLGAGTTASGARPAVSSRGGIAGGGATRRTPNPALSQYASSRARDGQGRFTPVPREQHAARGSASGSGMRAYGNHGVIGTGWNFRAATGQRDGQLRISLREYPTTSRQPTTTPRVVQVRDVAGRAVLLQGVQRTGAARYGTGFAPATIQLTIPRGTTIPRAELNRALQFFAGRPVSGR